MEKLQLAMLTQWAQDANLGGIQGRKRMQKVIYFLQQAGCPIEAEYTLHHYGPYSRDVAEVSDLMVAENLLHEANGGQFVYTLSEQTQAMIMGIRSRDPNKIAAFEAFRSSAVELLRQDLWQLELGSTILFFRQCDRQTPDWNTALIRACEYKKVDSTAAASRAALELAKRYVSADAAA